MQWLFKLQILQRRFELGQGLRAVEQTGQNNRVTQDMARFRAIDQGRNTRARLWCYRPIACLGSKAARRFRRGLWSEQLPTLVLYRLAVMTANRGVLDQLKLFAKGFIQCGFAFRAVKILAVGFTLPQ